MTRTRRRLTYTIYSDLLSVQTLNDGCNLNCRAGFEAQHLERRTLRRATVTGPWTHSFVDITVRYHRLTGATTKVRHRKEAFDRSSLPNCELHLSSRSHLSGVKLRCSISSGLCYQM